MRTAINVEFTDEELRRHVEDIGRRLILDAVHEVVHHINAIDNPALVEGALRAIQMGMSVAMHERATRRHEQRHAPFRPGYMPGPEPPRPGNPGYPPDPFAPFARPNPEQQRSGPFQGPRRAKAKEAPGEPMKSCFPIEANQYNEEGWCCHECGVYNGTQRRVCRNCNHERCDVEPEVYGARVPDPPPDGPNTPREPA